jgi:hypothetical protein
MNALFEPFKMIEYNENQFCLNIMNIGRDNEQMNCTDLLFGCNNVQQDRGECRESGAREFGEGAGEEERKGKKNICGRCKGWCSVL